MGVSGLHSTIHDRPLRHSLRYKGSEITIKSKEREIINACKKQLKMATLAAHGLKCRRDLVQVQAKKRRVT